MNRKEMDRYFSRQIYDSVRKFAERVMDAHPEITDELVVEFAAGKMEECADDGVEISVDDALRLTAKHAPIPTAKDFADILNGAGITTVEALADLLKSGFDRMDEPSERIPRDATERAAKMTRLGRSLSDGNADIVLMGIPEDLSWDFAQLKLAFFTDNLTEEEQEKIIELKKLSDKVKFKEEYGIGYGMFKINLN